MFRSLDFYRGLLLGLGVMYLFDPDRGRTRRALLRDKAVRVSHAVQDFMGPATRDLSHRAAGTTARAKSRLHPDDATDETLAERVRAKLGRYVSHPRAIEVEARDGSITLHGPILREEVGELIDVISSLRGVREVMNRLEPHATPEGVPELQGGARRSAFGGDWTPGMQLLAGVLGAAVVTAGATRIASRFRRESFEDLESEMPEYAMLR